MAPKAASKAAVFWRLPTDMQLLMVHLSQYVDNESIFPLPGSPNRVTKPSCCLHLDGNWAIRFVPFIHLDLLAQFANPPRSAGAVQLTRH
jgi:hypothetical protein